jgi:hypothetical protein
LIFSAEWEAAVVGNVTLVLEEVQAMSLPEFEPSIDPDDSPSKSEKPDPEVDPDTPLDPPEDTEHVDEDRPLDPPGGPEIPDVGYDGSGGQTS